MYSVFYLNVTKLSDVSTVAQRKPATIETCLVIIEEIAAHFSPQRRPQSSAFLLLLWHLEAVLSGLHGTQHSPFYTTSES